MTLRLTCERLHEVLDYNPETGEFTWKVSLAQKNRTGSPAGTRHKYGYSVIQIDGERIAAHRLAWLYTHGRWQQGQIDHINGVRHDNRLCNLRDVTHQINQQNQRSARPGTSSGLLGVTWHKAAGKWAAQIGTAGRKLHLGVYCTPEAAHAAYVAAKRKLHEGCTI